MNYWKNRQIDWQTQYFDTHGHPHRELILQEMAKFRFGSVYEVGCGGGANLLRIVFGFPGVQIGGSDINADAIEVARKNLPGAHLDVAPAHKIFMSDKSIDLTLTDALLIYIGRDKIAQTLNEIRRVTRRNVVFCEFHSKSFWQRTKLSLTTGYKIYDYTNLLEKHGFSDVEVRKIPAKLWPDTTWAEHGYIVTAAV